MPEVGDRGADVLSMAEGVGGLRVDQVRRLKDLERGNARLKKRVAERTSDGRSLKRLTVVDESTRECLAMDVERRADARSVLERLAALFIERGVPDYVRSDKGSEFTARMVRQWLQRAGVKRLFIEPGSPWENGDVESFNGKFREEYLHREIFDTVVEAKVLIERWRREYNPVRPHGARGYRPPAPQAILPLPPGSAPPGGNGTRTNIESGTTIGGRSPNGSGTRKVCLPLRQVHSQGVC